MPFATTHTVSLDGATGHLIDVQADVSTGQVATVLVGRPDPALNEARDRCRMAIINSGFDWPQHPAHTILLSPADLPKRGTHFDLAIAVAVLGALDVVPAGVARGHRPDRRADPVRRPALGAGCAADGALRAASVASPGSSCPSRRSARR